MNMMNTLYYTMFIICCASMLKAQFQAGLDSLHPFTILMNTDSAYYQTQSYGWFRFNTGNVSNVSGNLQNLKVALIPTGSKITPFYTVEIKVMNLYDSNFNLLTSDTLNNGDSSIVFNQTLNLNSDYYLRIYANYPCNTCNYPDDPVSYELALIGEPPDVLCYIPYYCYRILETQESVINTIASDCCCSQCGSESPNQCIYPIQFTVCPTQSVNISTQCTGNPGDPGTACFPYYIAYCTNTSSTIYTTSINTSGGYTFAFTPNTIPVVYQVWTCCSAYSCTLPTSCPMPFIIYQFTVQPAPDPSFTVTGNCENSDCTLLIPATTGTLYFHDWTIIGANGSITSYTNEMPCINLSAGTYTAIHQVYNSCASSDTLIFNVYPGPNVSVTASSSTICAGFCSTLTATGADTYNWSPINQTGSTAVVCPTTNTTYTVTGSNTYGCGDDATIAIHVTPCCITCTNTPITLVNATLVPYATSGAAPWSTLMPGNTYSGAIAIPSNSTITTAYLSIVGNLYVNAPNLTITSSEIAMNTDGATIFQNVPLNLINVYIHACNHNWWGIKSATSLFLSHCFIEDAFNAIYASGSPNHQGLTCNDVIFNKNYTGIQLNNTFAFSSQTNNITINGCLFTSRQLPDPCPYLVSSLSWNSIPAFNFTTIQTYPTALLLGSTLLGIPNTIRAQNGVSLFAARYNTLAYNNKFITIGSPSSVINYFDNLGNVGISGFFGSYFRVLGCYFNYFGVGADIPGSLHTAVTSVLGSNGIIGNPVLPSAIKTNTFTSCLTGILAAGNSSLMVTNNTFTNCNIAVDFTGLNNSSSFLNEVQKNNFTNCNIDVRGLNNTAIKLNIHHNNSTFVLTGITKSYGFYNVYLAEASISGKVQYTVNANTFSGKYNAGVYAQNINQAYITNNNISLHPPVANIYNAPVWLENTHNSYIQNNYLECNPSATSNWNSFGIFNSLGQNNEFCSNHITKVGICIKIQGNCPSKIWKNILNNNTADKAIIGIWLAFNGFTGDIAYPLPTGILAPAGNIFGNTSFFNKDFTFADTYCSNNSNTSIPPSKIYYNPSSFTYVPLVNGIDIPPSQPFVTQTTILSNQIAQCQNFPTFKLSPGIATYMGHSQYIVPDSIDRRVANKTLYEFIRKNAINTSTIANASNFMMAENASVHNTFMKIDSLVQLYILTKQNNLLNQAQVLNNSINPVYPSDAQLKNFNDIYFIYAQNDSLINTNHLNTLKNIASLCPYTHGTAVYQARAILAKYDTTYYFNGCEVSLPPGNARISVQEMEAYKEILASAYVYPNPAYEHITIMCYEPGAEFHLYDISGALVIQEPLLSHTHAVKIHGIEDGVYIYKVIKNNSVIKTDKLIIKHQ